MDRHMLVEVVFMMVILKIPILYLCGVVWWAIRAEPRPPEPAVSPARLPERDPGGCPWCGRARSPRRGRPCGGPRRPPVTVRPGAARAAAR